MILSRFSLRNVNPEPVVLPDEALFELPEKVLQFGTGVLLRGLPDYFIDKANRQGLFNGRIVVVKSTAQGDSSAFDKQDGLYTMCIRGVAQGEKVEENIVNASISRVLSASEDWEQILECAHNLALQIVISNTTEVGIQLVNDDIRHHPPKSYPGKLLAFLYERFQAFGGSELSGMVIVPTELIPDNGRKLESIVLELAHLNGLEDEFIQWLEEHNHFCNSLVDRIVPGKPEATTKAGVEEELGYTDNLMIVSEVYRLWAIEGDAHVRSILSFAAADKGVVIQPDINAFRELKLRLLNGTHTLSCGLAFLAGFETVKEAMDDEAVSTYISDLMQTEIAPAIPYDLPLSEAQAFGRDVLDRFRNPHIRHQWLSITLNYSSKMKMRCLPVLLEHYKKSGNVPELMAAGFAAYLCFMKAVRHADGIYWGESNGQEYPIQDEMAEVFYKRWAGLTVAGMVQDVFRDTAFWGTDLNLLPGWTEAVVEKVNAILNGGVREALESSTLKKVKAA
ncbi:MAG: tagaturonate reductase [Flaviaesturariibacter sp.]|nr:tagaturonate reductase [Flaviaesturariibacter sp.]